MKFSVLFTNFLLVFRILMNKYEKFRMDANLTVKIADFGLSRDVSACGMYEAINKDRGIPVRWMPIESLEEQQVLILAKVLRVIETLSSK